MTAFQSRRQHLTMFVLLVVVQPSQTQDSQNREVLRFEGTGKDQPELEGTTEAEASAVTWDPDGPSDGTDSHARDHHHDYDHYEKAHGHARDHIEQTVVGDRPHHEKEQNHDDLHHKAWRITQPGYDIRDRPRGGGVGRPAFIKVHIYADFIEYINEREGEVVVKIFIVAFWTDPRMRPVEDVLHGLSGFDRGEMPLPGEMKNKIWVPDLYLPTARHVSVPTIHQPAESLTLMANGSLKYSAFFVVSFKCEMHYHNYPMDIQQCNLDIMSYKYAREDMHLNWHPAGLAGNKHVDTKHFHVNILRQRGNSSFVQTYSDGSTKDVLRVTYFMRRHITFHLLQTYLPSIMLVFIGWLSLLVPLDFAYGRMVLSVTTLLVLVSIFVTTSQITPGINEVKALDIWLFMCIFFVFSAIVDCIADLRFLSMVEKESQIAGEESASVDMPPVVDERLRRASQGGRCQSTVKVDDRTTSYSVKFHGDNTPFQADKEVLIATPAVLKWLRMAVFLERSMTVIYPSLFVLFAAMYWAIYITARSSHPIPLNEE